jgi:chromate transport protein ChrA
MEHSFGVQIDLPTLIALVVLAALWSFGSMAVAHRAKQVGYSFAAFVVIGVVCSPIFAYVVLLLAVPKPVSPKR